MKARKARARLVPHTVKRISLQRPGLSLREFLALVNAQVLEGLK